MLRLIGAMMAATVSLAAAQPVPSFNVDPSCSATAREASSPDAMTICRDTEAKARAEVVQQWSEISAAEKAQCVPLARLGGAPTYTELLTCIELTREAKRLRSQEPVTAPTPGEPVTTGQRVEE
jgi:hypothetical protein